MRLDISDNPMTSEIAEDLAAALRQHAGLRCLNLNDTSLGDEGVATVAEAVAEAAQQLEVGMRVWVVVVVVREDAGCNKGGTPAGGGHADVGGYGGLEASKGRRRVLSV